MLRTLVKQLASASWHAPIKNGNRIAPSILRAKSRMFSEQYTLPKLQIPALQQTLNKFLLSVQPVFSEQDFNHAVKLVGEFGKQDGPGWKLQKILEERVKTEENWLTDWWQHYAYLDNRMPVPIHVNPGMAFPTREFAGLEGQLRTAAKLISGVLDYKVQIDNKTMAVEQMGGQPLCMRQFYTILSTCRIPGLKSDTVATYSSDMPNPPRHIVVAHNNHFFSVEVYGPDWQPLNTDQIYAQLKHVVDNSQQEAKPIGIITSENRDAWGKAYTDLCKDAHNKANFEEIHRSIFVVCLDKPMDPTTDFVTFSANQMNHGFGSNGNSGNRWFDKTLQFIVGAYGSVGLNYEHAPAEGPPIISVVDHTIEYMDKDEPSRAPVPEVKKPQRLDFNLTRDAELTIEMAKKNLDALISDLNLTVFTFDLFGKEFVKTVKTSPDAFIQMAIQLAYYKLHGHAVITYESGSLRQFKYGRTDTIRPCSLASLAFCKAMHDDQKSPAEKLQALKQGVAALRKYTVDVLNGQGIDRHLVGLKLAAIKNGLAVPDLLKDPIFDSAYHITLGTSQVASKYNTVTCYGPSVPDGYGICYNPMANSILFSVSTWNSHPETDSKKMVNSLTEALNDTQSLFLQTKNIDAKL